MGTFQKIIEFLDLHKIIYELKEHVAVITSEEAASARGEDLKIGAKAMLLKADGKLVLCVLSAARKIDNKKLKQILSVKDVRFASAEEVLEITGALPGGVPPFGNVFNVDVLLDKSILENEEMAFNAGERTKSLKMKTKDYVRLLKPRVEDFSLAK